jgi:hypothetical protein
MLLGAALAADPGLERIDVLAAAPGTWINDELPLALRRPGVATMRLVWQVQPVWRLPWERWQVRTSMSTQTVGVTSIPMGSDSASPPTSRFDWSAAVQTRLLLPSGVLATAGASWGALHVEVGASVISGATWAHRDWTHWTPYPTLGLGVNTRPRAHSRHVGHDTALHGR